MKLLTANIRKQLPALGSTDGKPAKDRKVICKFFSAFSNWTWYTLEGEPREDGDYEFFGYVCGFEKEFGYFTLKELEEAQRGAVPLVERDLYYGDHTLQEVLDGNQAAL
jgi:hypothetical protein